MKKWSVLIVLLLAALCPPVCHAEGTINPAAIAVGDIIAFGSYEQDNNPDNGPETIEWIVLDVQDGKALLLSKYGLDAKHYNKEWTGITWEECTLRSWLNIDFLNSAFVAEEQSAILMTEVDNSDAQGCSVWNTSGGNSTYDKIFLLSYAEANKYLAVQHWETDGSDENMKSRVAPTAYAIAQGASCDSLYQTADGQPAGWWWLRSPGFIQDNAAYVNCDGSLSDLNATNSDNAVRPAFWLDLESGI